MEDNDKRLTVRFNGREQAELELFKAMFHETTDSDAVKTAIRWCITYIKNVTNMFYPSTHEVLLIKKKKSMPIDRKVWEPKMGA